MNKKLIVFLLLSVFSLINIKPNHAQTQKNQYRCIQRNGTPTTIVETKRGTIELIVWKSAFFGNNWNPQKRCQEVTSRFQEFSDASQLRYITTGKINDYNVICVADPQKPQKNVCKNNGLLITLEPSDNPEQVKNELFDVSQRIQGGGITRGCPKDNSFYKKPILDLETFLNCVPTIELTSNNSNTQPQPQPLPNENPKPDDGETQTDPIFW